MKLSITAAKAMRAMKAMKAMKEMQAMKTMKAGNKWKSSENAFPPWLTSRD